MLNVSMKGLDKLTKQFLDVNKKADTFLNRSMSDAKKRGPGWIAQGVAEEYKTTRKAVSSGKLGRVAVKGDLRHLTLKYTGQRLDLTQFALTPKAPRQSYTLKAEVKRGQKVTVSQVKKLTKKQRRALGLNFTRQGTRNSPSSPIMLMKMPNQDSYHPFQRMSQNRTDLTAKKTVALPQMVTEGENGPLHPAPAKYFNEGLEKRIENHRRVLMQ